MTVHPLVFGSVAEAYERYRPDYPGEVADVVLGYCVEPVSRAVEVGAGTGKATRLVAGRGVAVTAVEPDEAMAAVLRRETDGLPVTVVEATFESWCASVPVTAVDLVFSAAAWHWTDPLSRWSNAAALLRPGGVLALFGIPVVPRDPALVARLDELDRRWPAPQPGDPWSPEELEANPEFTDVTRQVVAAAGVMSATDLVGLTSTVSPVLRLPPADRAAYLRELAEVLPDEVEVERTTTVTLARRA